MEAYLVKSYSDADKQAAGRRMPAARPSVKYAKKARWQGRNSGDGGAAMKRDRRKREEAMSAGSSGGEAPGAGARDVHEELSDGIKTRRVGRSKAPVHDQTQDKGRDPGTEPMSYISGSDGEDIMVKEKERPQKAAERKTRRLVSSIDDGQVPSAAGQTLAGPAIGLDAGDMDWLAAAVPSSPPRLDHVQRGTAIGRVRGRQETYLAHRR